MLEPQSTVLFVLLILIFGGLIWWLLRTRKIVLRVLAALLAFVVAMQFGVLAVNKYFGYYSTWGAAVADFSNQTTYSGPQLSEGSLLVGNRNLAFNEHNIYLRLAMQQGYTLRLTVPGKLSHITRNVYVYLPPAYFEPQYAHYKFPVIELIHGQPGEPQDWINVAGVQVTLNYMIRRGLAKPVVLVMPDANGSSRVSLQCLNQAGGPQDLTYLGLDVPQVISHLLRVQQPGSGWGVAGYSEGGFCAANMALRYRYRYGFAASISGYFIPEKNKLDNPPRLVDPFGGSQLLRTQNTPVDEVRALAPGALLPHFWLGAGQGSAADISNAQYFAQELQLHLADVPLNFQPSGGHTMGTWHVLIPPMLQWMTNGLADAVANAKRVAALQAAAARHRKLLAGAAAPKPADHRQAHRGGQPAPGPSASRTLTASK